MFILLIFITQAQQVFNDGDGNSLTVPSSCRATKASQPVLDYIRSTNANPVYKMNFSCNDIVNNREFIDAEDNGNSTLTADTGDESYLCTIDVNFDGSEYCCCPDRKLFQLSDDICAVVILPIFMFFTVIGGCLFCLKQKTRKAEYVIIGH